MKNSIVTDYIYLLQNKKNLLTNRQERRLATKLIKELSGISSLKELRQLLSIYLGENMRQNRAYFDKSTFFANLRGWDADLAKLEKLEKSAHKILEQLDEPLSLIEFINQLLAIPESLLHYKTLDFLNDLNSANLKETLLYLADLPRAPKPQTLLPGDYASIQHLNKPHKACIRFLNNNSATHKTNSKDSNWLLANSLLQNGLRIYKDIHAEEELVQTPRTCLPCTLF